MPTDDPGARFEELVTAWERRSAEMLEAAYVARGAGPRGSGSNSASEGDWRAKRQHLAIPMDRSGDWLDVGCANGHLLATLPAWAAERDLTIEPHGRGRAGPLTPPDAGDPDLDWVDPAVVDDDIEADFTPNGVIHIERPGRFPLQTIWLDRPVT